MIESEEPTSVLDLPFAVDPDVCGRADCQNPARYVFEATLGDHDPGTALFSACVEHMAELRMEEGASELISSIVDYTPNSP